MIHHHHHYCVHSKQEGICESNSSNKWSLPIISSHAVSMISTGTSSCRSQIHSKFMEMSWEMRRPGVGAYVKIENRLKMVTNCS